MKVMVMYNLCSEKLRGKVINLCLDYGLEKIQQSVYIGELSGNLKRNFFSELKEYGGKKEGCVRAFEFTEKGERYFEKKRE